MKLFIGLLVAGSLVIFGCGDDDKVANFSENLEEDIEALATEALTEALLEDLLVGTWVDPDGDEYTFTSDRVFIDEVGDQYTWSIIEGGDKLEFSGDYYGTYSFRMAEEVDGQWNELHITDPDDDFSIGNPAVFRRVN
jgi:hypothetical protein